jgi:hypothetical protein
MKTSTFGFIRFRHHALGESRARGRARRRRGLHAPAPQQQPKPEPNKESGAGVAQEVEGERRRAHERSDAAGEQRQLDEPGRNGAERGCDRDHPSLADAPAHHQHRVGTGHRLHGEHGGEERHEGRGIRHLRAPSRQRRP